MTVDLTSLLLGAFVLPAALFLGWVLLIATGETDLGLRFLPDAPAQAFRGKVALVTGASSGIGAALAVELAAKGATVVLTARREDRLREVAERCRAVGGEAEVLPLDLVDLSSHAKAVDGLVARHGRIDILVNNAGRSQRALVAESDLAVDRELFEINVFAVFSGSGQIVVTSSLAGRVGSPCNGTYSASKFAVHGFFDTLRLENAFRGLDVLVVCPGPVRTEITATSLLARPGEITGAAVAAADNAVRLSSERCAQLMSRAMFHRLTEIWVSPQPILFFVYLNTYFPTLANWLGTRFIGKARVEAFRRGVGGYESIQSLGNVFGGGRRVGDERSHGE